MEIQLENLRVSLSGAQVLKDVSLTFPQGLSYLIGLNGSGKTTLLHSLLNLVPYTGSISLGGNELRTYSHKQLSHTLALVKQHHRKQFPLNVEEFVMMGRFPYLNWLGNFQVRDANIVETHLQQLSLTDLRRRSIQHLSGGEFQRVVLARALCQETPAILLDEPAQSLDPRHKQQLYELLESLADRGKTIICTTHDLQPLAHDRAHIFALRKGQLIFQGKGGTLSSEALLERVY